MEKALEKLKKIELYTLLTIIFLFPLIVSGFFANSFITTKIILLVGGISILLILKSLKSLIKGSVKFSVGNFDFPVILLIGAYLASAILNTPNKMEAFFLPGTATFFIAAGIFYFLINQENEKTKKLISLTVYLSGLVVALIVLLANSSILSSVPGLPQFIKDRSFTPLGGSLPTAIFLASLLPLGIKFMISYKETIIKAFLGISLVLVLFGITICVFNLLPGKPTSLQLPSFAVSWSVTIDSLKEKPLLGIGPGNFITAFNRFIPISYNQSNFWKLRFSSARSTYLTIITETGLLGMTALLLLGYSVYKFSKRDDKEKKLVGWSTKDNSKLTSLAILAILMAIFPLNTVLIIILFILLALNSETQKISLGTLSSSDEKQFSSKLPIIILTLPIFISIAALTFYGARAISAEYQYKKALDAVAANDGRNAYDLLQLSIKKNPYVDRYHISYAQINLALANSLAQKKDLTDEDRSVIGQLIQQAIREGKAGIILNPQRSSNWEVLARTYQAVMPLAQDANTFAIQTFQQAVVLDPINPELRIALGGVYYASKDFESAIRAFELATIVKPDHPNSHYNLAFALKENNQLDKAINEMALVLSLVDRNSQDYETAKKALDDFQAKKEISSKSESQNLTSPQEQEQILNPPINLPEESQPPSPEPSPTPLP